MGKARRARRQVPLRNRSPFGWWVASYIERFEYEDEDKENLNRRCLAWENTIIIKAMNREAAYKKAEKVSRLGDGNEGYNVTDGRRGRWRYDGLTSLLPIYEELEDGAEILWKEHENRSVKKIKSLVKAKEELECFDDEDAV